MSVEDRMKHTKNDPQLSAEDPDVTAEFFPVTIIETVGEYNAEADTISVRIESHRDPDRLFTQNLSELPAEMREAAKSSGYKFWAKADITDIPTDFKQQGNESLKLSAMEPMPDAPAPDGEPNDKVTHEVSDL
jgi:hypothetical protein